MTSTADTDGPSGWPFGPGEMRGLIRTHDWAATPIGPMARWSRSLRLAVDLILESPLAMILLWGERSEEHTSELQSLMRISYAVFCLKKKKHKQKDHDQS